MANTAIKCVNCATEITDKVVCDRCRRAFPGTPEELEAMIAAFVEFKRQYPIIGNA